jgi:hypothetical protein
MEKFADELPEFLRRPYPHRPKPRVPSELEISRVANILVRAHGNRAVQEATMHLGAMIAQRNSEGEAAWRRVMEVIQQLFAKEARGGVN